MSQRLLIALGPAVLVAGCAGQGFTGNRVAEASDTDCVFGSTIRDWQPLDDRNLIVYGAGDRPYHVELAQSCIDLTFADVIAFYDDGFDERICGYGMDKILVNRSTPETCGIIAVDELTEGQEEDLLIEHGQAEDVAATR